jgi:predicted GH43/DUF377 family glycosyl hydrolase
MIEKKIKKTTTTAATKRKPALPKTKAKRESLMQEIGGYFKRSKKIPSPLRKFVGNPIIEPDETHDWESQYTFNPAAVYEGGKVHLVYRAIGESGLSVFGYASSRDGVHVDERLDEPMYISRKPLCAPKAPAVCYISNSGGSWDGCEDPRLTKLGDRLYMTYTAFDYYPRVALTSIDVKDFLEKQWHWKEQVFLSPPGEIHKNWVIFPEKINGKYAILHSITPEIRIDYFDSLDFNGDTFIKSSHASPPRKKCWDSRVRGVGPPPMRTEDGWLVLYHAIDDRDPGRYKMGAIVLDLNDPKKELYRSQAPILEPDERYENEGFKSGILYSCGAVVVDGTLFVYYGGADTVACVATANLHQFLAEVKKGGSPKLAKVAKLTSSRKSQK